VSAKTTRASVLVTGVLILTLLTGGFYWLQSRRVPAIPTIAFIPQNSGSMIWEEEHCGATVAAERLKCRLLWNAPTSENEMARQVSLIGRSRYQGVVLAPNHTLWIRTPVRRARQHRSESCKQHYREIRGFGRTEAATIAMRQGLFIDGLTRAPTTNVTLTGHSRLRE
jgi:hypothetical protein